MIDFLLSRCWPLLAGVAVKSLCVLALAAAIALALRRSSAAARHLVWRLALVGLLLLPVLSTLLPAAWQVPLVPRALLVTPDAPVVTPVTETPQAADKALGVHLPSNVGAQHAAPLPVPLPTSLLSSVGGGPLPWPVWLCALWLTGAVLTLLPSLIGLAGVARLARRSPPVPDGPLRDLMTSLTQELGVSAPIRLLTGEAGTPMTWGWRRPVILLPTGVDAWPEDRLRAVLLHELAHVARADWPAQMVSHLACALYWFNPAVWLAARQARIESERACDDRVLLAGIPAPDYARHLLDVARNISTKALPSALPMAHPSQIESRLRMILQPKRRQTMLTTRMITVAALATAAIIVPLAALHPVAQAGPVRAPYARVLTLRVAEKQQRGSAPERGGDPDPAAATLMARMYAAYHTLRSFSCTMVSVITTPTGAILPGGQTNFAVEKPDRMAIMRHNLSLNDGTTRAVCDGTTLYVTKAEEGDGAAPTRYLRLALRGDVNRLLDLSEFGRVPDRGEDQYQMFVPQALLGYDEMPASDWGWHQGRPGEVDGEPVDTVSLRGFVNGSRYVTLRLMISRRDHLLRRVIGQYHDGQQSYGQEIETFRQIKANPDLPASLFAFTPPPGSLPVSRPSELVASR